MKQQPENTEAAPEATDSAKPSRLAAEEADPQASALEFHPIKIKGEPLSAIIIRERRERPW